MTGEPVPDLFHYVLAKFREDNKESDSLTEYIAFAEKFMNETEVSVMFDRPGIVLLFADGTTAAIDPTDTDHLPDNHMPVSFGIAGNRRENINQGGFPGISVFGSTPKK